MAGKTSALDKCHTYGRFMSKLTRSQAEGLFWAFFILVILCLSFAATNLARSDKHAVEIELAERACDIEEAEIKKRKQKHLEDVKRLSCISFITSLFAIVLTVLGAFAAMTLQWCHGEDLMNFYWGFWTLIEVGSCIAIIGITTKGYYSLSDKDHPPWSIALGTPVLVIAGLGHMIGEAISRFWKKCKGAAAEGEGIPLSRRVSTASKIENHPAGATLLGFSRNMHDPIISFRNNPDKGLLPVGSILLGTNPHGGAIFQCPCTMLPASIVDSAIVINDHSDTVRNPTRDPTAAATTFFEAGSSEILPGQERNNTLPTVTQAEDMRL